MSVHLKFPEECADDKKIENRSLFAQFMIKHHFFVFAPTNAQHINYDVSILCHANCTELMLSVCAYRNELLIGLSTANTAHVHGCSVHTTRVHGPCWKKALHDNAFSTRAVNTARLHGRRYTLPVFTGRKHGP